MKSVEQFGDDLRHIALAANQDAREEGPAIVKTFLYLRASEEEPMYVLLFGFATPRDLRMALDEGKCFRVHQFVKKMVKAIGDFQYRLVFDVADGLKGDDAAKERIRVMNAKLDRQAANYADAKPGICTQCEHADGEHEFLWKMSVSESLVEKGWITCREAGCNCFKTWHVAPNDPFLS